MLYDLVTLRQSLTNAMNADRSVLALVELRNKINSVKIQVPLMDSEQAEYIDNVVREYDRIIEETKKPVEEFQNQLKIINDRIHEITHRLFAGNYELEQRTGTADSVRNSRRITISNVIEQDIKKRILLHTNWKYPALEIGCRDGEWTQFLVASDPLYIIDQFPEFLESANGRFNEQYQNRLRKYLLKNHDLSALPQKQMGFVFSWGYFNYVSLDTMKLYLKQIFDLLRPGGIFMFSYNDGDTTFGAGMAENFAQTYMPKSLLVPLAESMGYEVNQESDYGNQIHWIELKRPGMLETVKAHQVLGEINRREP